MNDPFGKKEAIMSRLLPDEDCKKNICNSLGEGIDGELVCRSISVLHGHCIVPPEERAKAIEAKDKKKKKRKNKLAPSKLNI